MITYPKVLWLIDDDPEDQFLVQQAFKSVQAVVVIESLTDGDEVVPALSGTPTLPNLILLDLNMVRMDGFETLSILRSMPNCQHIPVVVLSTSSNPKDIEKTEQLGAKAYHVKPFHYSGMVELASQLFTKWLS